MTCQLILMRHAKSDHDDPSLSDHDRPLSARGRRNTPEMAAWLDEQDCIPQLILCSSSFRTRETAELLLDHWDQKPIVESCESLYLCSAETMLGTIRSQNRGLDRVMVLAHNPGTSILASAMAERDIELVTAAIAIYDIGRAQVGNSSGSSADESGSHPLDLMSDDCSYTLTHLASPKTVAN